MLTNKQAAIKKKTIRILMGCVALIFAVVQFFPMVWVFCFSLCKDNELFTSALLKISMPPQWENYSIAFVQGHILKYGLNSLLVTGTTILLTDLFSLLLGYAFTRMRWKWRNKVFYIVLLGMMIPIHTTLLPNFLIFNRLNIIDTPLALIIPYTAFALPLGVFIMSGFMPSVPKSLEEAAIMDGCSIYGVIFRIVLPITKSALITITVMTFMSCWNEFIMAATYLNSETWRTLPFAVQEFAGKYSSRYSVQFAVMVLSAIPSIAVYIALNEHFARGVTFGAVKE